MSRLSAEQREIHRRRIIDAAARCIAKNGFGELRVEDICAEAAVSKGAFYLYFDRKEDVLFALLDEDATAIEARLRTVMRTHEPGVDRLRQFAKALLVDDQDARRVQSRADVWAQLLCERSVRRRFAAHLERRRVLLGEAIAEGIRTGDYGTDVAPETLARIVLAIVDGLMLHAAVEPAGVRWASVRQGIDGLIAGLNAA